MDRLDYKTLTCIRNRNRNHRRSDRMACHMDMAMGMGNNPE